MKMSYQITGMTCSGCARVVHDSLLKVSGVKNVHVDLSQATATLEMESHIPVKTLRAALGGTLYQISDSRPDFANPEEIDSDKISENNKHLVAAYLTAAGMLDHDKLGEYLQPDFTYNGPVHYHSAQEYLNMIREHANSSVSEILLSYDIKAIFADGNDCCAIYDSVSRFPGKNVSFVERITIKDGKIASTDVKFNRHQMKTLAQEMSKGNNA